MTADVRNRGAIGAICFAVATIEGFDLQAAGVAAPTLGPAFGMSPGAMSLFFSAATLGVMAGAAVGGRVADRLGRKTGLVLALACFGLFSLAAAQSWSVGSLLAFRFLTGFGLGGAMPGLIAIAAESARPGRSAAMVGLMYAGMPTGGGTVAAISAAGWHAGWSAIFAIGGVLPLVVLPLVLAFLPGGTRSRLPASAGGAWRPLFAGGRRWATPLLWCAFFLTLLILYLMLNWLPLLVVRSGIDRSGAGLVQVMFNAAGAIASVTIGRAVDRIGARGPLAAMFALIVAGLTGFALAAHGLAPLLLASAAAGTALMGIQAVLYAFAPALYPEAVRGTGVGAAVAFGRAGSVAGPLVAGGLVAAGSTPAALFAILVPVALLGGAAALAMVRAAGPIAMRPAASGA